MGSTLSISCCARDKELRRVYNPTRCMCCSTRDKWERRHVDITSNRSPQFFIDESILDFEAPKFMDFGPLWQINSSGSSAPKRLAVGGDRRVVVYRVLEEETWQAPTLTLEAQAVAKVGQIITSILFADQAAALDLIVSYGSEGAQEWNTNIFRCFEHGSDIWDLSKDWHTSLGSHTMPLTRLCTSQTYLVAADEAGVCQTWKKQDYSRQCVSVLHEGGCADLVVDKLFVYSIARDDVCVHVWTLPDLKNVMTVTVEVPCCVNMGSVDSPPEAQVPVLKRLTAVKRPMSRWSGSHDSGRTAKPRGVLFIAGVVEVEGEGESSAIMEWYLCKEPMCHQAVLAHSAPIAILAHGPYDNGPLISLDESGVFSVWDVGPRFSCSQSVDLGKPDVPATAAIALEPQIGLYAVFNDSRLCVWRRLVNADS